RGHMPPGPRPALPEEEDAPTAGTLGACALSAASTTARSSRAAACGSERWDSAEITDTPSTPAAITGSAFAAVMPAMPQQGKWPRRLRKTWTTRRRPSRPIGDFPEVFDVVL